ncbi:hypothetical protein OS493_018806 [Desmophyllum pertusum]|uniref:Uncharacterized protein n=1 Tax=Desmophyllum pertusum TaxID=174260 RepID=A0A9W9ZCE6_9CNID|nr:hypothetical protein OS493_018806 [Desmophyllum pertusum]
MKSQIILAISLALCLSNTSSSSAIPRNITSLDQLKSLFEDLQKQPDGKDILKNLTQILELMNRNMNSTTNESQSESLLPRTGSVPGTEQNLQQLLHNQPTVCQETKANLQHRNQINKYHQLHKQRLETPNRLQRPKKPVKQVSPTTQTTPESAPEISSKPSPPKKPVKQASPTQPTTTTTTQSVPGSESSSSTRITTKEAPPTLNTTISVPVNEHSSSVNDTKIAAAAGGNQSNALNNTDTSQRNSIQSFQQSSSNFPVIFMVILVAVIGVYFAYHNRSKIHRFIKEGYSKAAKQSGTGYVKVKVDDDIELPREANRQYVY